MSFPSCLLSVDIVSPSHDVFLNPYTRTVPWGRRSLLLLSYLKILLQSKYTQDFLPILKRFGSPPSHEVRLP